MVELVTKVLGSGSLRRFLAMVIAAGAVALNQRLGLNLPTDQLALIVATALLYVVQSAVRQGRAPTLPELVKAVQDAITQPEGGPSAAGATPPARPQSMVVGKAPGEPLR